MSVSDWKSEVNIVKERGCFKKAKKKKSERVSWKSKVKRKERKVGKVKWK